MRFIPWGAKTAGGPTPLGWWKFDDGSGTTPLDSSGNGYTGSFVGSPTWGTGHISGCITLGGSADYIDIPTGDTPFDFDTANPFTIAAWVNWTAGGDAIYPIVSKLQATGNNPGYIFSIRPGNARLEFIITGSDGALIEKYTDNSTVADGGWHHVAGTYNGNGLPGGLITYIAGSATGNDFGTSLTASPLNNTTLKIGFENASGFHFKGSIDDVRVYNTALSSSDIAALAAM